MGLAGFIGSQDNVHFGSVSLNNPQENQYLFGLNTQVKLNNFQGNQYVVGLNTQTEISGKKNRGNLRIWGLDNETRLKNDSGLEGNLFSAALGTGEVYLGEVLILKEIYHHMVH